MEGIVEEAEDVGDCLDECEITEYHMSLQTVPYDTKPYGEFFRSYPFNLTKDVIDLLEDPQ